MRLTRCYIENFGTLHRLDLSFDSGVTLIKEPNGFGKSTLAAFICAMLYGLPRANKTNLNKDRRRKYAPWQGGRFGGCMELELEGRSYRIERFFGDKPAQDSFAVYELPEMRPCTRFTENLGTELFGLDAESFERSTFISALSETGTLSTDSIVSKLSSLVEDTEEGVGFEKALFSLKKARTSLVPLKGNGGEVFAASEKISALQTELHELHNEKSRLNSLYSEIAELEEKAQALRTESESLRQRLIGASKQAENTLLSREKSGLIHRREELKCELSELLEEYPHGIPTLAELKEPPAENIAVEKVGNKALFTVFLSLAALVAAGGVVAAFMLSNLALGGVIFSVGLLFAAVVLYAHYKIIAEAVEEKEKAAVRISLERERYLMQREGALRLEELNKRSAALEREILEFEIAHPEIEAEEAEAYSFGDALGERYAVTERALGDISRSLAEKHRLAELLEEKTARIAEKENALGHFKGVKSEGVKKARELDLAAEYLSRAKDSLSKGYMPKLEGGFARYLSLLGEEESGRVFLDTDLSVRLERGGEARRLEYFSAGFSDIVMLCMRLALIDALFEEEKPFILMDDPFINLDDAHTEKALELVNTLGREYQVIYLTCSTSRI